MFRGFDAPEFPLRKMLYRLRYESLLSNAWHLVRTLVPLDSLNLWYICRRDLKEPLAPRSARIPIDVRLASEADMDEAARLDGGGENQIQELRSWVRAGNMCFVAKVGSEVVARGALGRRQTHFDARYIVPDDDELYLTGGYTAKAWRGNRIHLELEYRRLLWAQRSGAKAVYTLVTADNTRSMRNSLRMGFEATGLVLSVRTRPGGALRVCRIRGSLHPLRIVGQTPLNSMLSGNDVFEFENCLLVIPRCGQSLILLNEVARMMWEELALGSPPNSVADGIAARYGIQPALVRSDLATILAEWRMHGLLTGERCDMASMDRTPLGSERVRSRRPFYAERVYAVCGRPIRVRFDGPEIERTVHPSLAHTAVVSSEPADTVDIVRDGASYLIVCNRSDIERASTEEEAVGKVYGRILELSYPDAEWLAMLHAAAVGDGQAAVILAGDSGSGKSTLTAALVHAGLRYFSDDVVPLDQSMRVRPMPLGVSLKEGSWGVLAPLYPELEDLPIHDLPQRRCLPIAKRSTGQSGGLPVKAMVFPQHQPDLPTALTRLTPRQTLERLIQARCWLSLDGQRFAGILRWIEETPGYDLRHASVEKAVLAVRSLLRGEPTSSGSDDLPNMEKSRP